MTTQCENDSYAVADQPFTLLSAAAGILHLRTFGHPLDEVESLALDRQALALFGKVKRLVDDRDATRAELAEVKAERDAMRDGIQQAWNDGLLPPGHPALVAFRAAQQETPDA